MALAQRVGGTQALQALLGGATYVIRSAYPLLHPWQSNCIGMGGCASGRFVQLYDALFDNTSAPYFFRGTVVHELAHIIDQNADGSFSDGIDQTPGGFRNPLTDYTDDPITGDIAPDVEYWAEAVAIWTYGGVYRSGDQNRGALTADQTTFIEDALGVH
jgi:hypothetical protein